MPWKERSVMEERMRFVLRLKGGESTASLCREFGISRVTGYKIYERNKQCGCSSSNNVFRDSECDCTPPGRVFEFSPEVRRQGRRQLRRRAKDPARRGCR